MRGSKMGGVLLPNWSCSPILNKLLYKTVKCQSSPPHHLDFRLYSIKINSQIYCATFSFLYLCHYEIGDGHLLIFYL